MPLAKFQDDSCNQCPVKLLNVDKKLMNVITK